MSARFGKRGAGGAPAGAEAADGAQLARKAATRKRSLSLGLVTLGALALAGGAGYETTRRNQRQKLCAEAVARGQTAPAECAPSRGGSRGSFIWSGGSSGSGAGRAAARSSTQGVHFGGFGATGASRSFGGS